MASESISVYCLFLPSVFLQNGLMSGLMQILLLKVSAHITEQLGMAPGGEFREAFKEVNQTQKYCEKVDDQFIFCVYVILFFYS